MSAEASSPSRGKRLLVIPERTEKERAADLTPALLLEAASIENRLRAHVLELVEPVVRRSALLDGKLKEVRSSVEQLRAEVFAVREAQGSGENIKQMLDSMRSELAEWDNHRRAFQEQVTEQICLKESEIVLLRQRIELQADTVASTSRGLKHMGDLLTETKDEMEEVRRYCQERVDVTRDKVMKLRDDFETQGHSVELEQHRLRDDVTSCAHTFSMVKAEVQRLSSAVAEIMVQVSDLFRSRATVGCVEEQQSNFLEFSRAVDAQVMGLRKQLDGILEDVKGHVRTAADVVTAGTRSREIADMQQQCLAEVKRIDDVLKAVDAMFQRQHHSAQDIQKQIDELKRKTERKEEATAMTDRQGASMKPNQDTAELKLEVMALRKALKDLVDQDKMNKQSRLTHQDIMSLLVESTLLSAQLDLTDDQDRKNIALFGYKHVQQEKDTRDFKSSPNTTGGLLLPDLTPRLKQTPSFPPTFSLDKIEKPTLNLDKRCLSCSGSPSTVLAGFKLACLQYSPSPVEFRQVTYSRSELIRLRIDLLRQAQDQLKSVAKEVS